MSKKSNVNPDHYKVAGRERQGENIVQSAQSQAYGQQQAEIERWQAKRQDGLPTGKNIQQIPAEPKTASKPSRHPTVSQAKSKSARSKTPKASSPSPASRASNMRRTPARTS